MTDHERVCFNDALHKAKVLDTKDRCRRRLERKLMDLDTMKATDQMSYLFKLEEALR